MTRYAGTVGAALAALRGPTPIRWILVTAACAVLAGPATAQDRVRGVVFHDVDHDGARDGSEPGLAGIRVSNGRDVVETGDTGRYEISLTNQKVVFVLKPRGWTSPIDDNNLPRFYYVHAPDGSSPQLQYAGLKPTGPLPESVDFPLQRSEEPDKFRVVVWADPQVGSRALDLLQRDVIPELVGVDAAFGVTLGDIVWNNLDLFGPLNAVVKHIGIPWHNVIGNHDINFDHEYPATFVRHYGPPWYAFDYGPVHFIALDNVRPDGDPATRGYTSSLGEQQLAFVRNDLRGVPEDKLVVLMMHVALTANLRSDEEETKELFSLFEGREHVLALAGHNHRNLYHWFGRDRHWPNDEPLYQRVVGAVSGNWWRGPFDEFQIPVAMMRDGTPRGYFLFDFDGNEWSYRFKATRRPADEQMHLYVPPRVAVTDLADTEILANVYAGNDRSVTEMRVAGGEWIEMQMVRRPDPYYAQLYALQEKFKEEYKRLPGSDAQGKPVNSTHLWAAKLPGGLAPGSYLIEVRSTDMFGRVWHDVAVLRVTGASPTQDES